MADAQSNVPLTPVFFISHGGGPCFYMPVPKSGSGRGAGMLAEIGKGTKAAKWYIDFAKKQKFPKPKGIVVVSAHWMESKGFAVMTAANPPMFYDYYGFPDYTYEIKYPAPGDPELAKKVAHLLNTKNIKCKLNDKRGFDHGVFVPLKMMYPDADIPIVQLSINSKWDPAEHVRVGEAIASLRAEGIMIMGSGMATHGMSASNKPGAKPKYKEFVDWMTETVVEHPHKERVARLVDWASAPGARIAHPEEDHLIPLHVCIGAAKDATTASQINDIFAFEETFSLAAYRFD